jgi:hypothetical protein
MWYYGTKLAILPITSGERWQTIQLPGDHEKLELLKRTLLRWKPIHSLTPEYWIFMQVSHTVGIFVCVATGVVSKYFLFLCLLNAAVFQIMLVSNVSWKSLISVWHNVVIPNISCDNLSGEEMYSIHWISAVYVRRTWDMYLCASLPSYKWFQLQLWLHT